MAGSRRAAGPVRFALPDGVPDLVRAASLALGVARHCKAQTWAEFAERAVERDPATLTRLAGLDVTDGDSDLVARYDQVLRFLSVRPLVTVAVCADCGAWTLVGSSVPTRCRVTRRCAGRPVRASIATKQKTPAQTASAQTGRAD